MLNFFNEKFRLFLMIDLEYLMACLIWVRIFFFFVKYQILLRFYLTF
jgi:hypothetical protein